MLLRCPRETETEAAEAVAWAAGETIPRLAIYAAKPPAATPNYPIRALAGTNRIYHAPCRIGPVPILYPFPNVPQSVVQAKCVRRFLANWM